jgi:hypothetical protein
MPWYWVGAIAVGSAIVGAVAVIVLLVLSF